jgi:hypothetical protein
MQQLGDAELAKIRRHSMLRLADSSLAATLVPFEAQSLRSHAPYLFIKLGIFFIEPGAFRFGRILTQFVERFLNGELLGFGHRKISHRAENRAF